MCKHIRTALNSNDYSHVQRSIEYIENCAKQTDEPDVKEYLHDFLENNETIISELPKKSGGEYSDPGISNTFAAFAWIIWVGGILAALILGAMAPNNGVTIFFEIAAVSIVTGCFPMAVAYIIRYLAQIAHNTEQLLKKK